MSDDGAFKRAAKLISRKNKTTRSWPAPLTLKGCQRALGVWYYAFAEIASLTGA